MEPIVPVAAFILGVIIGYFAGSTYWKVDKPKESKKLDKYKDCKIILTAGGKYVPMFDGDYIFISAYGVAETTSILSHFSYFNSKEEAVEILDKWLEMRGIGSRTLDVEDNSDEYDNFLCYDHTRENSI